LVGQVFQVECNLGGDNPHEVVALEQRVEQVCQLGLPVQKHETVNHGVQVLDVVFGDLHVFDHNV